VPANPAWNAGLRVSPYRVVFEHAPDRPFFRIDRHQGARTLHLNSAHRFHDDVYMGPSSTPEIRAALEILLFTLGDIMLEGGEEAQVRSRQQLSTWSHRLGIALDSLADHLNIGDQEDAEDPELGVEAD
jgi:hypothetical protein